MYLFLLGIPLAIILIEITKKSAVFIRVKRFAEKKYESQIKTISFFSLFFKNHAVLSCENHNITITLLYITRKYAKYHFTTPNDIEVYVGTRETYRTGRVRYAIGKTVNYKLKKRIKLNTPYSESRIVLFSKVPMDITSAESSSAPHLGNGDRIFGNTVIYSAKKFMES